MDFGQEPDAVFDVTFDKANSQEHQIRITEEMRSCDSGGVYVFAFKEHNINRMSGASSIIRIGSTEKGLPQRLKNYNGKRVVTSLNDDGDIRTLGWVMRNWYKRMGGTEAYTMSQLWNAYHRNLNITLSWYQFDDPYWWESEFMLRYVEVYYELPPANLRFERLAVRETLEERADKRKI